MEFFALPRRDLQALCKRNGIRANMTNVAMAEALAALPTIDGIDEYVKQLVAVPEPTVKAVAEEEEEPRLEKQGSPLPRGRRVTAKSSGPIKPNDAKEEDATREPNNEDTPALGVGRRSASRRARPDPVVTKPTSKASAEEEKQGNQLASARRVEDGEVEEDRKREATMENASAPVVGRRGASRRARPAPAAESAGAGAGEEDPKQEASTDDAPALCVGRHGPSRRARPTPALAAPPGKVVTEEEQTALGVGRRGASRHARRAPAVADPSGKVAAEEEPRGPIPLGHGVDVKSPDVIRLDDGQEEEEKEGAKLEEKNEGAPAIGVGRRGASRRSPAPVEAPAASRRASPSTAEAVAVAVEAMPIRATRQRKPTMKAAAAAEEKVSRKATRRDVKRTVSQQEKQEKTQGVVSDAEPVPAPVSEVGCDNPEDSEDASQSRDQKQEDEDVVIIEDEILMEETLAQELLVTNQESTDYSTLQEQQVDVEKCPAPMSSQEDSPILGLVSMSTEQAAEKDEAANFRDGDGSREEALDRRLTMSQAVDVTLPNIVADAIPSSCSSDISCDEVEKLGDITSEMPESQVSLDVDGEETNFYADKLSEVVIGDGVSQVTVTDIELVQEEKMAVTTEEMPQSTFVMHDDGEEGQFQTVIVHADQVIASDSVPEVKLTDCEVEEEKTALIIDEQQQSTTTLDDDVVDADETKEVEIIDEVPELTWKDGEVVKEDKAFLITEEVPQSTEKMDDNVKEDLFQTVFVQADQVFNSDSVPDLKITDSEDVEQEKTTPIIDEKQQSTVTMDEDVVGDHFKTDAVHADDLKEMAATHKLSQLTGTEGEVVDEDKAVVITEEVLRSTGIMDDCVKKIHSEINFLQDDELNNAVITDNVSEVTGTDGAAKNTFTCDIPQELNVAEGSNDHITQELLDSVIESMCKSNIPVEPTVSVSEGTSVCNNSGEKNTAEPVATQEEKGVKVVKESVDLNKFSLGQLRAKLKKKLNAKKNKEAKRVALARVDENVCRSHSKVQQQNLNLQQH